MKAFIKGTLLLLIFVSIAGCSRKKNTFLNRNWHAVTAEYNTLYNGNLALEAGKQELNESYFDNYWAILPVERLHVSDEVMLPGYSQNPNFQTAEEKAVKAIQRHSMLIDGTEENPQIDEAYLLLGKARYFDQRFVPALEAFNYILHKYPLSNTITEARIWREKANIRLEFNELAIKNLKKILEQESIKDQDRANASAILAQAYINLTQIDSSVAPLASAVEHTDNKDEKGRYLYIKGQLYEQLGKIDSANLAFDEVIDLNRRSPRIYLINSHISKIRNRGNTEEDRTAILNTLFSLAEDRENRPFLDKIYFELAEFHYSIDSVETAVEYFNRSLKEPSDDAFLQSLVYESLGNINFNAARYQVAGAYYDSTLTRLADNSRDYRIIKKKRDNLEDVIFYEGIADKNDSILHLVELSVEERLEQFTAHTEELKEETRAAMAKGEEVPGDEIGFFEDKGPGLPGVPDPSNAFYFYNPTTVSYGKQEFVRLWGNRQLSDNWRSGSGRSASEEQDVVAINEDVVFENNPVFDPQTYISQIPSDPQVIDSLAKDRNYAYYQLGLIYSEKFNEYPLAAEKLEALLDRNPEERLILPTKYHLYKTYLALGETARAEFLKQDIIDQYPDSRYAGIILDPEGALDNEDSPEAKYNEVYALFEEQQYEEVIHQSNELAKKFTGEPIVPKFELLKATATGRLLGFEAYREALNYVALNHPQSLEGKKAQQLYSEALPAIASQQFEEDSVTGSYKLVFPLRRAEAGAVEGLQDNLKGIMERQEHANLRVSTDVYSPQEVFLVIHGFQNLPNAQNFADLATEEIELGDPPFHISTKNYRVVQIHKNRDTYLNTINQIPQ